MTTTTKTPMPDYNTSNSMMLADAEGRLLAYSTRFGEVHLREDRLISFPKGVLGFTDCTVFGLSKLPNVENSPIMLLQCVNRPDVAFMVADPATMGVDIKPADRQQALSETRMPIADTQFLVILTLYDQGDSYYLTANAKAPLLIDSARRSGLQHILTSKDYATQVKL